MNIYLNTETDFVHNGLGFLTDVMNPNVTDNLNGEYSLYFEYKQNGHLSEYLKNENIVKCKVEDGSKQLFIIKYIEKDFDLIKVSCKHIFYLLLDNFLENVAPTNLSGRPFLNWILSRTNYSNNFSAYSDISTVKSARYVGRNPVDAILGDTDNSMVNLFGGELKRDNFDIYFNSRIGSDNGVKLIIGKNITGIKITEDTNSVYTRIMPQGYDGLLLPEKYVDSPLIQVYPNPKIYKVDFKNIKYDPEDEKAYNNLNDAYDALRNATNELFESGIDKPIINVKVDWLELSKTNEYKNYSNLEKVRLGDTVTIDLLGITYKTRVIKTIYNPQIDRIISFELGAPKANIGTSTNTIQKKVEEINPNSILEEARDKATQLLTKALGGYVYKTQNELFIMDTNNPDTATKVWRWNLNGLGYSSSGIDGPYETAITQDGKIVADFITTGKLNTNVIEGYEQLLLEVSNLNAQYTKEFNFQKSVSGSNIHIKDASDNKLVDFSIEGKSEQATRSGKNLYNYEDVNYKVNEINADSDGWITATYDNTDGTSTKYLGYYTKPSGLLKPSTNYIIFIEIKEVSGEGYLTSVSNSSTSYASQSSTTISSNFSQLNNNSIKTGIFTTISDFSNSKSMIRSFVGINAGKSGSITFRLSVLEDTSTTVNNFVYEPYGIMPSPEYPSEIKSVGYENLFDGEFENGIVNYITGNKSSNATLIRSKNYIEVKPNTDYKFSAVGYDYVSVCVYEYDKDLNFIQYLVDGQPSQHTINFSRIFTTTSQTKYILFRPPGVITNTDFKLIMTEGITSHSYISYSKYGIEVKITNENDTNATLFVLNHPLRSLPNGVKDIAYIKNNILCVERKIGNIVLDGSQIINYINNYDSGIYRFRIMTTLDNKANSKILSNLFNQIDYDSTKEGIYVHTNNDNDISFFINGSRLADISTTALSLESFKFWLSEHNTEIQYELVEPIIEEIGEVEMPSTFKGVNNISTTDELEPVINLTYLTDTLLNAQYATKGELNITAEQIKSELSKKVSSNELETSLIEMNNAITQTIIDETNEINIEVNKKVNGTDYTSAKIIAKINNDTSEMQIKADKMSFEGKEFNMETEDISIKSNNFSVDKNGGKIANFEIIENELYYKIIPKKTYTETDLIAIRNYMMNSGSLSSDEIELYDINGDGVVNSADYIKVQWLMRYGITPNNPGFFKVHLPNNTGDILDSQVGFFGGNGNLINGFDYLHTYSQGEPIIQSNSNDNGSYTKFSDGTMVCYGQSTTDELNWSQDANIWQCMNLEMPDFPQEFISPPIVTKSIQSMNISARNIWITGNSQPTTDNPGTYNLATYWNATGTTVTVSYIAIGKWK